MGLTVPPAGISKLQIDTIAAIGKYATNVELLLLAPKEFSTAVPNLETSNVTKKICPRKFLNSGYLWFHTKFVHEAKKWGADAIWSPMPMRPLIIPKGIKSFVSVNDMVPIEFKDTQSFRGRTIGSFDFGYSINSADYLLAISRYTKEKMDQYFPKRKMEDVYVGSACGEPFTNLLLSEEKKNEIRKQFGLNGRFLLFVGSLEPRKNLEYLLKLMIPIHEKHPDLQLLIVGGRKWKTSNLADIINSEGYPRESVVFSPFIDESDLINLYNTTDCYVSTALNEGLGLPPMEAMKCGAPVVVAHNSAMIEVVENRGITVKGWEQQDWINAIDKALAIDRATLHYDLSEYEWKNIIHELENYLSK